MQNFKRYLMNHFKVSEQDWDKIEGILRYFSGDEEGDEPTCYFTFENHYIIDPFTYDTQEISSINLKSITDCKLAVISFAKDQKLREIYPRWAEITNAMLLKVSIEFSDQRGMMLLNASKRYINFVNQYPQLAQRVPLQYIASYLGIAQPSLSRIRKNMVKIDSKNNTKV